MAKVRDFNSTLMENAGNYTLKFDVVDSSTTYIGKAEHGTANTSTQWQIKKISVSGTVTTISYANGDDTFDKSWDERTSYSY